MNENKNSFCDLNFRIEKINIEVQIKKEWYGASSSLHKRFQEWNESGLWKKIYRLIVKYYQKKRRIQWKWQAVDSKMVPAPLGGDLTGSNPTDRAKSGSKRHIWVDQRGAPLSICITAANAHDVTEIMNLLNCPIVRINFCLNKL